MYINVYIADFFSPKASGTHLAMSGVALRVTPFSIRKRSARRRPLPPPAAPIARAPAPLEKPSWEQEAADEERALLEDKDGKVIEKIEDHLLKICRQSQLPVIPDPAADVAAAAKAGRASPPVAFRLQLLPHMFCVEGLSLALPYSQDNLRFLQLIEQGRLPWDQLRAIEELRAQCEGKYVNGALYVEIDDRRQPNHGIAEHDRVRTITLHMDDDALLQDLAEAELAVVMNVRARALASRRAALTQSAPIPTGPRTSSAAPGPGHAIACALCPDPRPPAPAPPARPLPAGGFCSIPSLPLPLPPLPLPPSPFPPSSKPTRPVAPPPRHVSQGAPVPQCIEPRPVR